MSTWDNGSRAEAQLNGAELEVSGFLGDPVLGKVGCPIRKPCLFSLWANIGSPGVWEVRVQLCFECLYSDRSDQSKIYHTCSNITPIRGGWGK